MWVHVRTPLGRILLNVSLLLLPSACVLDAAQDDNATQTAEAREANWTCDSVVGKHVPNHGRFYVTSFGCWIDDNGNRRGDSDDNCVPYCQGHDRDGYARYCNGLSGAECERRIGWYTADADRFGCFSRIRVTNPDTGKSAVLMVLDRGPACTIERKVDHWVLDMSNPASNYLFGGPTSVLERATVVVEPVSDDTPLGPSDATPYIGDGCRSSGDCAFDVDGQPAHCLTYGQDGDGPLGFCTVECEGYCSDRTGKATTFCASLDGGNSGHCVSQASAHNGHCSHLPGINSRELPRHTGDSDAPQASARVCAP